MPFDICMASIIVHFQKLAASSRENWVHARHIMDQATYRIGEKVLCYETEPGKVNKLYPAVVYSVRLTLVCGQLRRQVYSWGAV